MSDDDDDDLFDADVKGKVRRTDPDTSVEAAGRVPVTKLEQMFLEALRQHDALTTTEVANFYGMERDSFSPRPPRLLEREMIERAGKRQCLNAAGRMRWMIAFRLKRAASP